MDTKTILLILIAALAVLLAGCINSTPGIHPTTVDTSKCDNIPDNLDVGYDKKGECYYDLASETKDIGVCDKMVRPDNVRESERYLCYSRVAGLKNDMSICEEIPGGFHGTRGANDEQINDRSRCFHSIAVENKDIALCDKIQPAADKQTCRDSFQEGTYFNEDGVGLGACKMYLDPTGTTNIEYYDLNAKLLGSCNSYHGIGSSGCGKTDCNLPENLLQAVCIGENCGPCTGKKEAKYACITTQLK
jgi:predicted small secreted protein